MIKSFTEQNFFDLPTQIREAVKILSVPYSLNQQIAEDLLEMTGVSTIEAAEMVKSIKSYRVWVSRSKESWSISPRVREDALSQLEENALSIKKIVLQILKCHQPAHNVGAYTVTKDYYLQMARLSLSIPEERIAAVDFFRSVFNSAELFNNHESARVISIYVDENLQLKDWGTYPENIWNLFFIRGIHAYRQGDYAVALQYLTAVWETRGTIPNAVQDVVIACYYMGLCYKSISSPGNAEDMFLNGLQLVETINNEDKSPIFTRTLPELQSELEAITKH